MILLLFNVTSFSTDFYRRRLFSDIRQKPFNYSVLILDRVYIFFISKVKSNSNNEILLKVTYELMAITYSFFFF